MQRQIPSPPFAGQTSLLGRRARSRRAALVCDYCRLSAVSVPSQHYLGSAMVDTKTNEIPVARELFKKLDLDGRKVSLDALHTQDQTARDLVLEHGADLLLTVTDNQPTVRANIEKLAPAPLALFSPSTESTELGRSQGI